MKLLTFFVKWNYISSLVLSYFITLGEMKWHFFTSLEFHFMTSDEAKPSHESWNETKDEWRNVISFHPKWWNNERRVMKYHFISQKMSAIVHFNNLYIGETIYFTILVRKRTRKIQWYEPYMYCTVRTPYNFMKKRRRYPYNYPYIWPLTEPNSWLSIDFHSIFQWFLWFYSKNWDLR